MTTRYTITYRFNPVIQLKDYLGRFQTIPLHFANNSYFMPLMPTIHPNQSQTIERSAHING